MSVVSNTTVVSNFAGVHRLEMLQRLLGKLFITTEVYQEIRRGLDEGYTFYRAVMEVLEASGDTGWLRLTSLDGERELSFFASAPAALHAGEAASLAVAQHRGWLFLTDDKAARAVARKRQARVSGTVGCLLLGVERGIWSAAQGNKVLRSIIESGFYSPVLDLDDLLREPGG